MSALIDGFFIDVVETEQHSYSSDVTAHPVEQGADVADNVRAKPRELTFTNAVVSDTPIGDAATARNLTNQLTQFGTLGNAPTLLPSQDALQHLESLWRNREPVQVVSNLKKYDSMVLDKLDITRNAKTAGGLVFNCHFIEVIIVRNNRVTVAIPDGGGKKDLGGKNTLATDPRTTLPLVGDRLQVVSFQLGDPRALQIHQQPISQPDGTTTRGINAVYVGPDDPLRSPNRGNIECYLVGGQGFSTADFEQKYQTTALNYPADGYVLMTVASASIGYVQFKGTDGKPLTRNSSTGQYTNASNNPITKDPGAFTGGQQPGTVNAQQFNNAANQFWNQRLNPSGS